MNNSIQIAASRRGAFTLVELLVVIAIIGILIGLLLPAVQAAREAARRMQCSNNVKQLLLSFHNYADVNGAFPPEAWLTYLNGQSQGFGILARILPFLEQSAVYSEIDFSANYTENEGDADYQGAETLTKNRISGFLCPSNPTVESSMKKYGQELGCFTSHYYGLSGAIGTNARTGKAYSTVRTAAQNGGAYGGGAQANNGIFYEESAIRFASITDGTSNTAMLGEIARHDYDGYFAWIRGAYRMYGMVIYVSSKNVEWKLNAIKDKNDPLAELYRGFYSSGSFSSEHSGGVQFGFADGSVHFISDTADTAAVSAAASRNGAEVLSL